MPTPSPTVVPSSPTATAARWRCWPRAMSASSIPTGSSPLTRTAISAPCTSSSGLPPAQARPSFIPFDTRVSHCSSPWSPRWVQELAEANRQALGPTAYRQPRALEHRRHLVQRLAAGDPDRGADGLGCGLPARPSALSRTPPADFRLQHPAGAARRNGRTNGLHAAVAQRPPWAT